MSSFNQTGSHPFHPIEPMITGTENDDPTPSAEILSQMGRLTSLASTGYPMSKLDLVILSAGKRIFIELANVCDEIEARNSGTDTTDNFLYASSPTAPVASDDSSTNVNLDSVGGFEQPSKPKTPAKRRTSRKRKTKPKS